MATWYPDVSPDAGYPSPVIGAVREWLRELRLAPDGRARPDAAFARGPLAAHVLAAVIDASVWAGSRVPARLAHALATIGGHGEWALRRGKRRRLATNLAHALGAATGDRAVRRVVRREIVNEAHRSADLLWALGRPERFLATVELNGIERAQRAADAGNGVILAGLHLGGWEVATAVPRATLSVPTTVIVADDWLAWAIAHMRVTAGLRVMYRTSSAMRAARLLRRGEALLMLGDDGSGDEPRTYGVRFLDSWAELPAGMVTLSRLCASPIVTFAVVPDGPRRWRVIVDEPVGPPAKRSGAEGERELLQNVADRWSAMVRDHPEHWAASYRIRWFEPEAP
jgi:lauroyl/myristoyl acyltransferase